MGRKFQSNLNRTGKRFTGEAHAAAHADYEGNAEAKKHNEKRREAAALKRLPAEQVARLDKMFGNGNGAVKERAKLAKRMAQ